ncbi:hypothetical protein OAT10_01950 [Luminiphilus sp.]|nr:hypothetical protein [Luminiphilus sp.]
MKIALLCSDQNHPIREYLQRWMSSIGSAHNVMLHDSKSDLDNGDILFLISCTEIVGRAERTKFRTTLVLHASDLPEGRGWSPHVWQLLSGAEHVTLSLLEAEDQVDSGRIWAKRKIAVPKDALWNEINDLLFQAEIDLIDMAVENFDAIQPQPQSDSVSASYYPRRTPRDSKLDPHQTIAQQFNKIRICDPNRFPAFFELYGKKYKLALEKIDD